MKQVLAEHPFPHTLFQILMRCRNDAHPRLHRLMATDAEELPVAQHAQQPRLQLQRHVTDFVQKQRAPFRLLETPAPLRLRPRERPPLMTEQFTLEQILGNRRRVDGHERPLSTWRMPMQRPRHQFLASATLPGDQHRRRTVRQPPDGTKHLLHGRRLPQHLLRQRGRFFRAFLFSRPSPLLHGTPDQLHRFLHIERLGQILVRPALERRHRAVQIGKRRHHDHRQRRMRALHPRQQIQAGQPRRIRHADVADQHHGHTVACRILQRGQHLSRALERHGRQLCALQGPLQHKADGGVVVDNPD